MLNIFHKVFAGLLLISGVSADASTDYKTKFIVKFNEDVLNKRTFTNTNEFESFYDTLKRDLIIENIIPSHNFTYSFSGISFFVESDSSDSSAIFKKIRSLPIVEDVWHSITRQYNFEERDSALLEKREEPFYFEPRSEPPKDPSCDAPANSSEIVKKAISDLANVKNEPWGPYDSTNYKDVQFTGKNVVIAFLDTGADYNHEALASKFVGGYDLVGDDYPNTAPNPDADPMDSEGHGTSAIGIALGNSKSFRGVAPDAKFLMYRVFSNQMLSEDEIIIRALEKAVQDGADIISISAGDMSGFTYTPVANIVNNIVKKGIIVIFAAGNDGTGGPYIPSGGASAISAVTVGVIQTDKLVSWPSYLISDKADTPYDVKYVSANGGVLPLDGAFNVDYITHSLCSPADVPSRNSTILLLPHATNSECSKNQQYAAAASLGYTYVVYIEQDSAQYLYNSYASYPPPLQGSVVIPKESLEWITSESAKDAKFKIVFNSTINPVPHKLQMAGAGYISSMSSWGPTYDGYFYPDIAAPGGNVFAPHLNNTYRQVSGTSFSTPYIAGVAALFLESRGLSKLNGKPAGSDIPQLFKKQLMGYGKTLDWYDGSTEHKGLTAPLIQQGAGQVDIFNTIYGKTVLSEPYINLNSTYDSNIVRDIIPLQFKVTNNSPNRVKYSVYGKTAGIVNTRDDNSLAMFEFPPPVTSDNDHRLNIFNSHFTLNPGQSRKVSFQIYASKYVIYKNACLTGKIFVKPDNGPEISMPYLAFAENSKKKAKILMEPVTLGRMDDQGFYPMDENTNKFKLPDDFMFAALYLNFGTLEYSLDLVKPDFDLKKDFHPELFNGEKKSKRFLLEALAILKDKFKKIFNLPRYTNPKYIGPMGDPSGQPIFPAQFVGRMQNFVPLGSLSDGSKIQPGKYRILTRALKAFGNPIYKPDWETNLSEVFEIV